MTMILKQGVTLAGAGIVAGLAAAFGLTRLMQTLLYQVRPSDPETFVLVSLALVGVAVIASAVPAYRATRVSPLIALRTE
jgi:putative ABC transport system permease protein